MFHICFLTCISSNPSRNMPLPRRSDAPDRVDVLGKRNVAQINANFEQTSNQSMLELPLWVNNGLDTAHEYDIELVAVDGYAADESKLEVAIRLSDDIYKTWENSGKLAEKVLAYSSQPKKLYMESFGSKIVDLNMAGKQAGRVYCTCEIIANEDVTEETVYAYDIILRDKQTGEAIDGERFYIKQQPRAAILPTIAYETTSTGYELKAQNVDEAARFEWYDETGAKIAEGSEVNVAPQTKNSQYRLKVVAESDGAINYASVSLDGKFGVKSISPNPFTTQLTVTLDSPAGGNTVIRITPANGLANAEEYKVKSGESELTIYTSHYAKGNYIVSLLNNGKIVDSRQIICN